MRIATNATNLVVAVVRFDTAELIGDVLHDGPTTLDGVAALHEVRDLPDGFWIGGFTYNGSEFERNGRTPKPAVVSQGDAVKDAVRLLVRSKADADSVTWAELRDVLTAVGFE